MTHYFGIPDIHDTLAREKYPSDLANFETRITQAIIRGENDKVFISQSQERSFITLEDFYKDRLLSSLVIQSSQREVVGRNTGEFLSDAILRQYTSSELEKLLSGYELTPYNNNDSADIIADSSSSYQLRDTYSSGIINNKSIAQHELGQLGVLVPNGKQVFNSDNAISQYKYLSEQGYGRVSFKLNQSINGMGVFIAKSFEDFLKLTEKYSEFLSQGVLVDGWIENKIASPNIQFYVGKNETEDKFICCSDQILVDEGTEHIGNISDNSYLSRPQLQRDIRKIIDWVRSKGGYGVIGIDFLITDQGAFFIEINGRYNGSTHGAVIANKIGSKYWGTHDGVSVPEQGFEKFVNRLESDKLIYKDGGGILPVNPATIPLGKTMVLALGDTKRDVEILISRLN